MVKGQGNCDMYKALKAHRSWDNVIYDDPIKSEDRKDGEMLSMDKKPLLNTFPP